MFSPDGTLISASAAPHCGNEEEETDEDEEDEEDEEEEEAEEDEEVEADEEEEEADEEEAAEAEDEKFSFQKTKTKGRLVPKRASPLTCASRE